MNAASSVATLWIGPSLPVLEQICLRSWVLGGYDVTLFTYDVVQNIPPGVRVVDANTIIPKKDVFQNPFGSRSYAGFSNIFRYKMLLDTDLVWIDSDVLPGGKTLQDRAYIIGWESKRYLNGALLGIRDKELCRSILEEATLKSRSDFSWGDLGPKLLTRVLTAHTKTEFQPQSSYYGLKSTEIWKLFDERHTSRIDRLRQRSEAVHLWSEGFKIVDVKLDRFMPPVGSFLSALEIECEPYVPENRIELPKRTMNRWKAASFKLSAGNYLADLFSEARLVK